ncbi:hypothetical protein RBLE17_18260 [Rhodobacteraceae bacterium LE17]|jgi:hypothetical protein|nr:hypothetical protein [Rhodobacteraceae bacterium LE17]
MEKRNKITFFAASDILLYALAMVTLVSISLGRVTRWDLLQQIAMSDRFIASGNFYPEIEQVPNAGVSIYFPGNALIASILSILGVETHLIESMHLIACVVLLLFIFMQYRIAKIYLDYGETFRDFAKISILIALVPCSYWLSYSAEFKPDTIAFVFGLCGLVTYSAASRQGSVFLAVLGGLFVATGVMFKQQYLLFVAMTVAMSIFVQPNTWKWFVPSAVFFSALLLAIILDDTAIYWSIQVVSDDGTLPFAQLLITQLPTAHKLTVSALVLVLLNVHKQFLFSALQHFKKIIKTPNVWFLPVFASALLAVGSAAKDGGNAGNVQLGLVLLLPLWAVTLTAVSTKKTISLLAWLAIISNLPEARSSLDNYKDARALHTAISTLELENSTNILIDSNAYYIVRPLREDHRIIDYWSLALKENSSTNPDVYAAKVLQNIDIDLAVLRHSSIIENYFNARDDYQIYYRGGEFVIYLKTPNENAKT